MPNYVNDMAADEETMDNVVDATVAGVPVQTGTKETVGTDTLTVIGGLANFVNSEWRLRPTDRPGRLSVLRKLLNECLDQMENTAGYRKLETAMIKSLLATNASCKERGAGVCTEG